MESTSSTPSSEGQALDTLKSKINDPAYPTLDLARALQSHLDAFPQPQRTLAEKLGMPEKRSLLSEHLALLKLPASELSPIEKAVVPRKVMQRMLTKDEPKSAVDHGGPTVDQEVDQGRPSVDQGRPSVDQGRPTVDQGVDHEINGVDHVYSYKERSNPLDEGFPLLKDTVNTDCIGVSG